MAPVTSALMALALASVLAPLPTVAMRARHRCAPYAERCRGTVIYTCSAAGRWRRGLDCARAGRRDRVTVCSQEPDGAAVCVEDGGAS